MKNNRPLVLVDLDDTLFQTARKMTTGGQRTVASLDISGQPSGYMDPVQDMFINWLLDSADVVPVTARSTEAYNRVKLPFTKGAICSHGGSILHPDGSLDNNWHSQISETLREFQQRLPILTETTLQIGKELGHSLRGWVVEEKGLHLYTVIKQNESDDTVLANVLAEVQARGVLDGMHIHANGNNLAFLPNGLAKRFAVEEWLRNDRDTHGTRPVLGFGDSITDLGFMQLCHMWGTPTRSQLAKIIGELAHG
ncbi:hypothetical protein ACJJIF_00955 [Microbulbifer sp. SSSA002]|uniref:hypothetical protein n=1 Tax=Microbulbifer sp. SSSA002 TaxID=3243376 RepID=UPI0040393E4E